MQAGELEARLKARGVEDASVRELMACLDRCDRERFAPPSGDAAEEGRFLAQASQLMSTLDGAIR